MELQMKRTINGRVGPIVIGLIAALLLSAMMFAAGYALATWQASAPARQANTPDSLAQTFAPFWETWNLVHEEYYRQPVSDTLLVRGAIQGMLQSLGDAHTGYMPPSQFNIATSDIQGQLEGIGAEVDSRNGELTIVAPLPDSPAEKAGLQPGDVIVTVDGREVTGMPLLDAIMLVRGPAGTTVHLEVRRAGQDRLLQFDIVRARIQIASVTSRLLEGGYAYVRISTFGDRTTEELRQALQTLLAQNPKGLILDLRGNPGGNLYTALDVASQFIKDGPIMIEEWGDGRRKTFNADGRGLATGIPLMVLVDQGSASASEIVAGAIQDRGRGRLVGEKTFGKGTVQDWRALDEGRNGGVRITIARWLTPNGRWVHEAGLTPDILVVRSPEDVQAGRDPQLEAALNALKLLSQSSMAVGRQDAP
ncbi:MAG: peptidase S41 [Chloroflexota bacterium]